MAGIAGKWVEEGGWSNMNGILDAVGVSDPAMRCMICSIKPVIELSCAGDTWQYVMTTPHSSRTTTFRSGDTVDYQSMVGRPVKATIIIGENAMEEAHNDPNDPQEPTIITREFNGDVMTATVKVKGVESVGIYKRVA